MNNNYYGKLIYNENGEYEIHSDNEIINISNRLNKIYYHPKSNLAKVRVESDKRLLFSEIGNVYYDKNDCDIYSLHINGECLEDALFNAVDENVEIIIVDGLEDVENDTKETIYSN